MRGKLEVGSWKLRVLRKSFPLPTSNFPLLTASKEKSRVSP